MDKSPPPRHRASSLPASSPSPWVARFLPAVPAHGRILDVACGSGRHLRYALARGYPCVGIDRDIAGAQDLATAPNATLIEADLETGAPPPFRGEKFQGVVVTNYLWRPLLPDIVAAIAPDGVLIYETFALGNERIGKPSNPDFLLAPGELIAATRDRLIPMAYEHVRLTGPDRIVQRIAALGPDHPWLQDPPLT